MRNLTSLQEEILGQALGEFAALKKKDYEVPEAAFYLKYGSIDLRKAIPMWKRWYKKSASSFVLDYV